jgi:cell division protein FtsB
MRWLRPITRFLARLGLAAIIFAVFVFGVFPTGRYVEQRQELDRSTQELRLLEAENAELQERVDRLESDEEIERVARGEYDLVRPNEEVYAVLPPAGG